VSSVCGVEVPEKGRVTTEGGIAVDPSINRSPSVPSRVGWDPGARKIHQSSCSRNLVSSNANIGTSARFTRVNTRTDQ
jgi:hypothetical protein